MKERVAFMDIFGINNSWASLYQNSGAAGSLASPSRYRGIGSVMADTSQYRGIGSVLADANQYRGIGNTLAGSSQYRGIGNVLASPYSYTGLPSALASPYQYRGTAKVLANPGQYAGITSAFINPYLYTGIGNPLSFAEALLAAKDRLGGGLPYSEAYATARGRNGFPAYGLCSNGCCGHGIGRGTGTGNGTANVFQEEKYQGGNASLASENRSSTGKGQLNRYGAAVTLLNPQAQGRLESALGKDAVEALPKVLQEMQEYPESAREIVDGWMQLWA